MPDLSRRIHDPELMDEPHRPDREFKDAYRELEVVNRYLGGVRAVRRNLPAVSCPTLLDVAAGGCDVGEALAQEKACRGVSLDSNLRGLRLAKLTLPVAGDAFHLPFRDQSFDVVAASLFFHHLSDEDCVRAVKEMWRVVRRTLIVNDLHRHAVAYYSIRFLTQSFSRSVMVRHDAALSVRRAFRPEELRLIAQKAGIPAIVRRSFPYRLVLVAQK